MKQWTHLLTITVTHCEKGFHACENPLDCFGYYNPAQSVFHEVEIEDNGERNSDDSKVVGTKIKIGAKLDIAKICKLHFDYVKERCEPTNTNVAGDKQSASAGEYGSASAGKYGSASAGKYGSASAGYRGSAVSGGMASVGENGSALARGNCCKIKGGKGSILVLVEENKENCDICFYKAFKIDGKRYKPDTWYTLDENGKVVKAE